jgi:predicted membrane protein
MNDYHEQRREERRRMREEWKARFRERHGNMMDGAHMRGYSWTGVLFVLIGIAALLKAALVPLPYWMFTWPMLLIVVGIFVGIRHGFRGMSWVLMILIGGAFLADHIYPDFEMRRYTWPAVLIVMGLFFIFRPRRRWHYDQDEKKNPVSGTSPDPVTNPEGTYSKEDFVNATSVFGGTKKIIISKNFKGGDLLSIFGGTELDLSKADINGKAILELINIFGGTKLIIPSNWTVKSEAAVIFGGIEDKRSVTPAADGSEKILLLKGTVMFGGVDIKSY